MIIDTNVNLSRWPFRRVPGDEPAELVARLRQRQVTQAWAASFEGLLHKDMGGVNERLAIDCGTHGPRFLVPFGSINPTLPDWEEDLRRCHEVHRMPGIRLHPNYHGYTLDNPVFFALLSLAAQRGLLVQLVLCMEDERVQHPLMRVPTVRAAALAGVVRKVPKLRLQILNCSAFRILDVEQLRSLSAAGDVYFDFAMTEGVYGLERLLQAVSAERVAFGSHSPLFYFESTLLKVREAGLQGQQEQAVLQGNARRLLGEHPASQVKI